MMVEIQEADGAPHTYELAQLSDGYRNLLSIVLDFARSLQWQTQHGRTLLKLRVFF